MEPITAILSLLSAVFGMLASYFAWKTEKDKRSQNKEVKVPASVSSGQHQASSRSMQKEPYSTQASSNELLHALSIVFAIFLPPLAVYVKRGIGTQFWINVILTIFVFYIPGPIHALCIVLASDNR